ncbi:hypothetical protein JHK85_001240 [Glycine max]|nr:hypothetical protein JHK85_001240 [Glycine max]
MFQQLQLSSLKLWLRLVVTLLAQGAPVKVRRPIDYNPSLAATLGPRQPNPNLNQGVVSLTPGLATGLHGPDRISWDFPLPESGCCWLNTWTVESNPCDYADTARSRALFAYVNFVDLARSERASQAMTACTRLREGSYINHSLLSLGTVIQKLRYISYAAMNLVNNNPYAIYFQNNMECIQFKVDNNHNGFGDSDFACFEGYTSLYFA